MLTGADTASTRLLKTKMFVEQITIKRLQGETTGAWGPPIANSKPLDTSINEWVDQTGNELVSITTPGMYMQWMDAERMTRLVISAVMVTYIPSVSLPIPHKMDEPTNGSASTGSDEPIKPDSPSDDWKPISTDNG